MVTGPTVEQAERIPWQYLKGQRLPDTLYHYTSADSFLKIIRSGCLFLSDARSLNDAEEVRYGIELLNDKTFTNGSADLRALASRCAKRLEQPEEVCIASFSTDGDSLPQWRSYGAEAEGFAIGFDTAVWPVTKHLPNRTLIEPEMRDGRLGLHYATYDRDQQIEAIEKRMLAHLGRYGPALQQRLPSEDELFDFLFVVCCVLKHPCFLHEDEWRVLFRPGVARPDGPAFSVGSADYRLTPHSLVRYYPWSFREPSGRAIKEIVIGARNRYLRADIEAALALFGHHEVNVRKSRVPFRG